jgi:hypothetical protein
MNSFVWTRGGLVVGAIAVAAFGLAPACSSSSNTPPPPANVEVNDSGYPVPLPDGAMPSFLGDGGSCPVLTSATLATRLSLNVTWNSTESTMGSVAGSSNMLYIWLLSNYTVNSDNTITGNTFTCGDQTPPFSLTAVGSAAGQGEPTGTTAQLQITFKSAVWDAVMATMNNGKGTPATGAIGGWNIGSSFVINPVTSVLGLKSTSMYADPSTTWPASETSISPSDYSDDDNDGHPGITATPLGTSATSTPYVLPVTALSSPAAITAEQLFVVTRTELALYGKSITCTTGAGTATVKLLNNHVIGCELSGYPEDAGPDADLDQLCDDNMGPPNDPQAQFLDTNTTQYIVASGVYDTVQLPSGSSPTCETVRAMLPASGGVVTTDEDGGTTSDAGAASDGAAATDAGSAGDAAAASDAASASDSASAAD